MNSRQRVSPVIQGIANAALVTAFIAFTAQSARADDPAKLLKAMADYTTAQKSISAAFDSDIEVVTPELEKIQFTSSGKLQLARPDKLRVSRTGGYADVQLVYDGKTVSIYGNNAKAYAQVDLTGTVDQLADWQIWIESGARPVPRKYVITSKTLAGAPQYTLRIKDWKTDAVADADTFVFKPPSGVTKVDLDSGVMAEFDEIPPGTPSGAKK